MLTGYHNACSVAGRKVEKGNARVRKVGSHTICLHGIGKATEITECVNVRANITKPMGRGAMETTACVCGVGAGGGGEGGAKTVGCQLTN